MNYIKRNFNHLISFFKFILERLFSIILLSIIIFLLTVFLLKHSVFINPKAVDSQEILVFGISLGNLSIYFTAVVVIITAIWSMYQYIKNSVSKQQEKASIIAQLFADNLIERMGLISDVLMSNKHITSLLKQLDTSKLNQFTELEMEEIMNDKNCIIIFNNIIHSKKTQKKYESLLNLKYNPEEQKRFDSSFPVLIDNTLNKLEALCINISSKAAGSEFIYDSLHQMFLSTVEILAIKMSYSNTNNVDKYYVNIISVYNMWNSQKKKDIKKANKTQKKIDKLQKKADKEEKKLLNKQAKTIP